MKATVGDAGPDEMKDGMGKADKLLLAKQAKLLLSRFAEAMRAYDYQPSAKEERHLSVMQFS